MKPRSISRKVLLHSRQQEGAVLVVGLIFLFVLTLLALSGMGTTGLEEKMAGNLRDQNLAFQAAESGLRDAEGWIFGLAVRPLPDAGATQGVYLKGTLTNLAHQNAAWWTANATLYGSATGAVSLPGVHTQPRYLVEYETFLPDSFDVGITDPTGSDLYRVTARGTGGTDTALTVLQTTYIKRFN